MSVARALAERVGARLAGVGLGPDTPLVVAWSGGLDSTVLVHLLRFALPPGRWMAAHFDHGMRAGSASDAAWVRGAARAWGVTLREGRAEVAPAGETAARALRWAFLEGLAGETGAAAVVTAHHAGDQAETVIHNLLRGTGLRGLGGMEVRAGGRVRPLLGESRAALEAYAGEVGLRHRQDPTNVAPWTPRNRIRHEVIPLLEEVRPGAVGGILRTAGLARREERALAEAESAILAPLVQRRSPGRITADLVGLRAVAPALRARLLRRLVREVGGRLDAAGTRAAMEFSRGGPGGSSRDFPGGVSLRRSLGVLEVEGPSRAGKVPAERPLEIPGPGPGTGAVVAGGEAWEVRWDSRPPAGDEFVELAVDPDAFPLRVRAWRAGDRLSGPGGGASVARLWQEAGVPRHERMRRPVVEDRFGRLVWVPGTSLRTPHDGARGAAPFFIGIRHVAHS